jgi:nucleobase:cation symporter-1, NCS1 family
MTRRRADRQIDRLTTGLSSQIAFNGATGVIHHTPFPVIARAAWGFWGSYVAIVSRAILATFWFAIQTMNGAFTVRCMIGAIWPSFLTLPSNIPPWQGIDDATLGCFVIFWLLQIPFLVMHPNRLRWLFMAKSIVVPIAWVAILIWALVSTRGSDIFDQRATVSGPSYSWAFLASMNSVIGNYATLSVNQADFSRYSRVSVRWQCMYVPLLPAFFTFIAFVGIASASAGGVHYGVIEWDPIALISHCQYLSLLLLSIGFPFFLFSSFLSLSAPSLIYIKVKKKKKKSFEISWNATL